MVSCELRILIDFFAALFDSPSFVLIGAQQIDKDGLLILSAVFYRVVVTFRDVPHELKFLFVCLYQRFVFRA